MKILGRKETLLGAVSGLLFLVFSIAWLTGLIGQTFAQETASVYFEPASSELPSDSSVQLMIDTLDIPISFAAIEFTFDPAVVNLAEEIVIGHRLTNVIKVTPTSEANVSGRVVVDLGLSLADAANPPSGIFELASVKFKSATQEENMQSELLIDEGESQLITSVDPKYLEFTSQPGILFVNVVASPTQTLTPTSIPETPTPNPSASPTPTLSDNVILSFNAETSAFKAIEFPVGIDLVSSQQLAGVDAVIKFDPSVFQIIRFEENNLLDHLAGTQMDNTTGIFRVSQTMNAGTGFSGSGSLGKVIFEVIGEPSTSILSFDYVPRATNESNAISLTSGLDLLGQPEDLSVEILVQPVGVIKLTTASENTTLGHAVAGTLATGETFSIGFTTNSEGLSAATNLPLSAYNKTASFLVKVNGYLRESVQKLITDGENLLDFGLLRAGDLDDNGVVNTLDLSLMYDVWFGSGIADYNKDGIVNSSDYWLLTKNFFQENE